MDTIKEYLNNLFLAFPETPEVLRAKEELLEMMEDKFEECLKEGKSEKEAVGVVVSEFGNIEEIAEELGISEYLHTKESADEKKDTRDGFADHAEMEYEGADDQRNRYEGSSGNQGQRDFMNSGPSISWKLEQAKEYLAYAWKHGWMVGAGVACFIFGTFLSSVVDDIPAARWLLTRVLDAVSGTIFFLGIVAGVVLLSYAGRLKKQYPLKLKRMRICIDEETAVYMQERRKKEEEKCFFLRLAGIVLCILSVVPSGFSVFFPLSLLSELFNNSFLFFVAAGVMLIIVANSVSERWREFGKAAVRPEEILENGEVFGGESGTAAFHDSRPRNRGCLAAFIICIAVFLLVVCLGIVSLRAYSFQSYVDHEASEQRVTSRTSYDMNRVEEVDIDLDTEDVNVRAGDVEKIQIDYAGYDKPDSVLKNGVLKITSRKKSWIRRLISFGSFYKGDASLTVMVPKQSFDLSGEKSVSLLLKKNISGAAKKWTIATDTGDVSIEELVGANIDIDADTGDVTLKDVVGKNINIDADTGEVRIENVAGSGIQLDADTGDVSVKSAAFQSMECELDTGDFDMQVEKSVFQTYRPYLTSELGDVIVYGVNGGYSEKEVEDAGSDDIILKVDTDTGDITIEE